MSIENSRISTSFSLLFFISTSILILLSIHSQMCSFYPSSIIIGILVCVLFFFGSILSSSLFLTSISLVFWTIATFSLVTIQIICFCYLNFCKVILLGSLVSSSFNLPPISSLVGWILTSLSFYVSCLILFSSSSSITFIVSSILKSVALLLFYLKHILFDWSKNQKDWNTH